MGGHNIKFYPRFGTLDHLKMSFDFTIMAKSHFRNNFSPKVVQLIVLVDVHLQGKTKPIQDSVPRTLP